MAQAESEDSLPDRLLNTVECGESNLCPEGENTEVEDTEVINLWCTFFND